MMEGKKKKKKNRPTHLENKLVITRGEREMGKDKNRGRNTNIVVCRGTNY